MQVYRELTPLEQLIQTQRRMTQRHFSMTEFAAAENDNEAPPPEKRYR